MRLGVRLALADTGGTIVTSSGPFVPGAPTGVTAVPGNTIATANWATPGSDGGSAITGYQTTTTPATSTLTFGVVNSGTITGLTNGVSYVVNVQAINAVGAGAAGTSSSFTPSAGTGTGPTAPTTVRLTLQGLNSAGSMPSGDTTPQQPNKQQISWVQGTAGTAGAIVTNNIYRSTTSATAGFGSTPYATMAAGTSYTDNSATNCANGTAGAGPPTAPWFKPTTYWYKVTAVDSAGNESAMSPCPSFDWYKNGVFNGGPDLSYPNANQPGGIQVNYSAAGQWSDGSTCITVDTPAGGGGFQPTTGQLVTTWNFGAGMFSTLEFDIIAPTNNRPYVTAALASGDRRNYDTNGNIPLYYYGDAAGAYSAATVAGAVTHVTFPIATLCKDYGAAGGSTSVIEIALYKFFSSDQSNAAGRTKYNNIRLNP